MVKFSEKRNIFKYIQTTEPTTQILGDLWYQKFDTGNGYIINSWNGISWDFKSGFYIPEGLIILLNDTSIPSGWERFTSADDKYIVGAGSTYAVDATGGANYVISEETDSAGAHTGPADAAYTGGTGSTQYDQTAGAHTHTISGTYTAAYQQVLLIRALRDTMKFPAKSAVLSGVGGLSLTNIFSDGYLLKSDSSVSSAAESGPVTTSSDGSHHHGDGISTYSTYATQNPVTATAGAHTHTVSGVYTPAVKRKILSAWSDASVNFNVENDMIALWESATPPSGWAICNGSGGTVDLRDYFIELCADGNENTAGTGNNTLSATLTATTVSWSHSHTSVSNTEKTYPGYHNTYSATHSHTGSVSSDNFIPPYYALYFIQKL